MDTAAEDFLREVLRRERPHDALLGEERAISAGESGLTWVLDPIDGTVNFSHGLAYWCVSIAAAVDDVVVAGVIAAPALAQVFAVDLDGFTVNGASAQPRRVEREVDAFVISTFPRHVDLESNGEAALHASGRLTRAFGSVRTLGSGALGLAHVAAGWADATFDLHTNAWDVAAGALMVRAGGGRYLGLRAGVTDENPTTAHLRPAYWATGGDVEYPTLREVLFDAHPYQDRYPVQRGLPEQGRPKAEILAELREMAALENQAWETGQCSGTMYCGDLDHYAFLTEAFGLFAHQNALQRDMCPSATRFEGEIIAMALDLMHANAIEGTEPAGLVTSGGTGSILQAMPTRRSAPISSNEGHREAQHRQARDRPPGLRQGRASLRPRVAGRAGRSRDDPRRPGRDGGPDRREHHRDHRLRRQLSLRDDRPDRRPLGPRPRPRCGVARRRLPRRLHPPLR